MSMRILKTTACLSTLLSLFVLGAGCIGAPEPDDEDTDIDESAVTTPICLGTQSGKYCGNDMMSGANASTLYQCPGANKAPTSWTVCANGCVVAPPGYPDYCASGPICLGTQAGAYCGNDMMSGASASTLYQCPGANKAPTSSTACANGCVVAPSGYPDYCASGGGTGTYKLPWKAGTTMSLTQDCNDSCCADHVGNDKYAYDFGNGTSFDVVAARGGTVTHLKINSTSGCGSSSCVNKANYIVVDHGDGTQSTYLHLAGMTLAAGVSCGTTVVQGQKLAKAGTTGWSTGTHLHFEVSKVHTGAPTCECGQGGTGCSASTVPWANFWPNATYPTVSISFVEWSAASQCANRRITMPASQN